MDVGKLSIEKLNSKNYIIWAAQVEAVLAAKGLWNYVEQQVALPNATATNYSAEKQKQEQCRALILCSIETQYIPLVVKEKEPHSMFKKLKDAYSSKCAASEFSLRSKLMMLKMSDRDTIRKYANSICSIQHELSYSGHELSENEKKFTLLNGLREEYEMKKQILLERVTKTSFEQLVSSLEHTEEDNARKRRNGGGAPSDAAFYTATPRRTNRNCFLCNRPGHMMKFCFYNPKGPKYRADMTATEEIKRNIDK